MFTFQDVSIINYANRCKAYDVYKDVLVLLDQDCDSRIYNFIDSLRIDSKKLCAVMENEGRLFLLWHNDIPEKYIENKEVIVKFKHDKKYLYALWQITKSVSLSS